MHAQFAEIPAEGHEIFRGDRLVREDEDAVFGVRLPDRRDRRFIQRPGQVDAGDLRAQKDADPPDRERDAGFRE
ncbi:MAG: hypothetical protein A3H95_18645 [Acidobacteria bacterium RIFCSPLOWO2_02_FULL_64_15]|nr:MAG: hypothetical protein A3H95_18645 [Acidobacteria bacterium RIFCSPLOWO2_02_FULL_64_15]